MDVNNTWTKGLTNERERERKKRRKKGRKDLLVSSEVKLGRKVGKVGRTKRWLTRYSSQTRTTAWKGWLDRDHSCRRLIRAIFHGKLSTDQRRKMKKVFFLTALTCANIPSIPSRLEATLEIILEKERREERPFRSSLSLCLIGEN